MIGGWIIMSQGGSGAGRDRVTRAIEKAGWGWWHWFDNVWLVPGQQQYKALAMIEWLKSVSNDGAHWLVLRHEGRLDWAAIADPKASDWLKANWKPDDPAELMRQILGS